jgi:hypothetical protein
MGGGIEGETGSQKGHWRESLQLLLICVNCQGHTPNFEKIVDRCNGSIIIIDTGQSYRIEG